LTFETLERLRLFVGGHRQKSLAVARNAELNGYKSIALEHQNEAAFAAAILQDLANEKGTGYANPKTNY
jgi:hypothetical protein